MKKYIGLTLAVVGIMLAIPTYAVDYNTSYLNTVVSKTTSAYQTNAFEAIGIAGIAADHDGLNMLTLKRSRATGELITLTTQTCSQQKSCALSIMFTPSNSDAGQKITFTLVARDVYGNETSSNRTITVESIPTQDTTAPTVSIDTSSSRTITIPRTGSSVEMSFTTTVSDASGVRSVTLYRTSPVSTRTEDTPWVSNFDTARGRNCLPTSPCTQRANIMFTTADIGKTVRVYAQAIDFSDNRNTQTSPVITFTVVQEATVDTTSPTGSITATPSSFTLGSSETGTVQLRASVQDNVTIQSVRFYRTNPQNNTAESVSTLLNTTSLGTECNTSKTNCTFSANTLIPGIFAGLNTPYYAIIKDAAGNETRTASVNVRVNARTTTTTSTTSVPTVTISPTTITMDPSATRTLSATASSTGGVYAIELRAQPSWTDTVIKKRCTLNSSPRSGSCTMDIGPFTGRSSGTIRYWAIAWDATSGMGGNSGEKTATITNR